MFHIEDVDNRRSRIEIYKDRVVFYKIKQSIVILNIFSRECPPCRGMLPYLNDLQKRNKRDVFIIGVLINSGLDKNGLRDFMRRYKLSFFISEAEDNPKLVESLTTTLKLIDNHKIPLTIIYKDGKYIIHLLGATPPEMIQNIIDQLK